MKIHIKLSEPVTIPATDDSAPINVALDVDIPMVCISQSMELVYADRLQLAQLIEALQAAQKELQGA